MHTPADEKIRKEEGDGGKGGATRSPTEKDDTKKGSIVVKALCLLIGTIPHLSSEQTHSISNLVADLQPLAAPKAYRWVEY